MNFTHTGRLNLSKESIENIRNCGDIYSEVVISMNGDIVQLFISSEDDKEIVHFRTPCGHDSTLEIHNFNDIKPFLDCSI